MPSSAHVASIDAQLFDPARLPGLSAHGRALLRWMREHPSAPHYRDFSGHRLNASGRWQARVRHALLQRLPAPRWQPGAPPPVWLARFVAHCAREVPAHAGADRRAPGEIPTTDRHALAARLAHHMPRHLPIDRLICFSTSGSTGHPLRVPSHPRVASDYFALHRRALREFGITPRAGRGEVGIVLAGFQQRCFSYVSVNPLQGECGLAKLNLHPNDWRSPGDRAAYLDALAPELISGDPVSLSELLRVGMRHRPRALLSTSMALLPGLRQVLMQAFDCPVADVYSLNEVGPIGVFVPELDGFLLLQPRLLVEIVDPQGRALPFGRRGEIVVTGGFNPWLPLLRYRTGDFAQLAMTPRGPVLRHLQGRAPVRFRTPHGVWLNNVDVTQALAGLALTRFALHQTAAGGLHLRVDAAHDLTALAPALRNALTRLFGDPIELRIESLAADDKVRQYTSDHPQAHADGHPQPHRDDHVSAPPDDAA